MGHIGQPGADGSIGSPMGLLGTIELAMLSEFNLALSEFESMCSWHGFVSEGLLAAKSSFGPRVHRCRGVGFCVDVGVANHGLF